MIPSDSQQAGPATSEADAAETPGSSDPWAAARWRAPWDRPVGVLLSEVEPESVSWQWPDRIARGKLTLLEGDPGQLKSTIALDLAARVSTGRHMPDGARGGSAGGVVILSAEDGLADTIRPRLDAAGADPERILAVPIIGVGADVRLPVLPFDLPAIEQAIKRVDAKLLIVDPLMAYLSPEVNSYRDQDVRRALAQLAELAERRQVAVVVIRHLNKSQGMKALYRGGGSIGLAGAARSVLLVGEDPDHPDERVLAVVKTNLGPKPPSLRYRAVQADNGAVTVEWLGTTTVTADLLLARGGGNGEVGVVADAVDFLDETLADGPVGYHDLRRQARAAGISEPALRRAKKARGVIARKTGMTTGWAWELPPRQHRRQPEDDQPSGDDHLRQSDRLRAVDDQEGNDAPEGDQPVITFAAPDKPRHSPVHEDDHGPEGDQGVIAFGPDASLPGPAAAEDDQGREGDQDAGLITFGQSGGPGPPSCPDCGLALDPQGKCWPCDYGPCRDCGERTPSALVTYCGRHRGKPAPTEAT